MTELGDLAALGRSQETSWENNKQTKLTMESSPETKVLQPIGVGGVLNRSLITFGRKTPDLGLQLH